MKKNPKVSIILACYNESKKDFKKAIESILTQSFKDFEFIIILDNDQNKELENEILRYIKKDKRIVFIKNKTNSGLAYSLNKGIKLAKGKYIARMDADDISKKDRLQIQYNYMEKNKKVDLLFSKVHCIDVNGKFIRDFNSDKNKVQNIKKYYFKEFLLVHPTLFCKTPVLKKNLFNIKQLRSQDFELWIRIINNNYKFDLINDFLLDYRIINQEDHKKRIKKVINSYHYGLTALNKNFLKIIFMRGGIIFYLRFLFMRIILFILPIKLIKSFVLIKDRLK